MNYCILMADIIKSKTKESVKLMKEFKALVIKVNESSSKSIISPLTITLGDEFQGIIKSVPEAINLIFKIEEALLKTEVKLKLRYVINVGEIETKINRKIAHEMLGMGLSDARFYLTALKKEHHRFKIKTNTSNDTYINKSFNIFQNIRDSWKQKDAQIVSEFLYNDDYKVVSKKINRSNSSVWRRKKSLRINEYNDIKDIILYLAQNTKSWQ